MSTFNEQSVVITATVMPVKAGKRHVIVSAAPEGEMPVVRSGNFSELKNLFDEVWLELLKRKPQTIKHPKAASGKGNLLKRKPQTIKHPKAASGKGNANATKTDDTSDDTSDDNVTFIDAMPGTDAEGNEIETDIADETAVSDEPDTPATVEPAQGEPTPDQLVRIDGDTTDSAAPTQTSFL